MVIRYLLLALTGLSGGTLVAAGVFALITSTGVMTRMAGKTHTGNHIRIYESAVIFGGIWWNAFWVFNIRFNMSPVMVNVAHTVLGLCQGIFVGCLAVSLAEALNATAIFSRRINLKTGLSFVILSSAVGKIISSLIQFANNWVK